MNSTRDTVFSNKKMSLYTLDYISALNKLQNNEELFNSTLDIFIRISIDETIKAVST